MEEIRITGLASGVASLGSDQSPVAAVLDALDVAPEATHCSVVSRDGAYTASIPIDDLRAGGMLFLVPPLDGGPVRLRVMEGSTLCWNVKDVGELRFTAGEEPDSIPANPTH